MNYVLGWFGRVLPWVIIVPCCSAILISVLVPRMFGATPYTIRTGSMAPSLPAGTVVIVRPVSPEMIGVGTVITYQMSSGDPTVVTHRVVEQGMTSRKEIQFRTQGDANSVQDQDWVRPVQIRGEVWYAIPYLGFANQWISTVHRRWLAHLTAAGLLCYATFMFGSVAIHYRKGRTRKSKSRLSDAI